MKKTVVLGMSGGVDSSVAAAMLLEQGYNVIGLFMHNWPEEQDGVCTATDDWNDCVSVSAQLGIPCYSVNFSDQYMNNVFAYFLDEYRRGYTPNPDVLCNREIKFGPFKQYALRLGADLIATGHYCGTEVIDGYPTLLKARDTDKDQTYFLNQVRTHQLSDTIFPLAGLDKSEVREIAVKYKLATAKKKDSTGICFIGERKFKQFLSTYLPGQGGRIVDTFGNQVGMHDGLMYYTLGQRKGLGIGGIAGSDGRWYVVDKRLADNVLVVSCGEGEELLSSKIIAQGFNVIGQPLNVRELECTAKFRYRQAEQRVLARFLDDGSVMIESEVPQRAVTPGQYAVLYLGDRCIGGGVIRLTQ